MKPDDEITPPKAPNRASTPADAPDATFIPTGLSELDGALGTGGLARGAIVELSGAPRDTTALALALAAAAQKTGGVVAWIDTAHDMLDVERARALGVAWEDLLVSCPDANHQSFEIIDTLVCTGAVDLVVASMLAPPATAPYDGLQARLASRTMRKLTAVVHRHAAVVVFLPAVQPTPRRPLGAPYRDPIASALKFYASVRLEVRRLEGGSTPDGSTPDGSTLVARTIKNVFAPPFQEARLPDLAFRAGCAARAGDGIGRDS